MTHQTLPPNPTPCGWGGNPTFLLQIRIFHEKVSKFFPLAIEGAVVEKKFFFHHYNAIYCESIKTFQVKLANFLMEKPNVQKKENPLKIAKLPLASLEGGIGESYLVSLNTYLSIIEQRFLVCQFAEYFTKYLIAPELFPHPIYSIRGENGGIGGITELQDGSFLLKP